jgi:hypothetical protein
VLNLRVHCCRGEGAELRFFSRQFSSKREKNSVKCCRIRKNWDYFFDPKPLKNCMKLSRNDHDYFKETNCKLCAKQNHKHRNIGKITGYRTLIGWYLYAILMRNCHSSMSKLIDSLASEKRMHL